VRLEAERRKLLTCSVVRQVVSVILRSAQDPRAKRSAAQLPLLRPAHEHDHSGHPIRFGPLIGLRPITLPLRCARGFFALLRMTGRSVFATLSLTRQPRLDALTQFLAYQRLHVIPSRARDKFTLNTSAFHTVPVLLRAAKRERIDRRSTQVPYLSPCSMWKSSEVRSRPCRIVPRVAPTQLLG